MTDDIRPEPRRRLYDFDFSVEGAEVSLVDKAANGHAFLVLKAEDNSEQLPSEEMVIKNIDMLRSVLGQMLGLGQAQPATPAPVSNPLQQSMNGLLDFLGEYIRNKTDSQPVQDRIEGVNPYQQSYQTTEYLTEKSENNMPLEDIIKSEEGQALISELVEKSVAPLKQENEELRKSLSYFEKQEQDRRSQEFVSVAKSLEQLGFTEEHGPLLKALCDKAPEEYAVLSELLSKSIAIQDNQEMFKEVGTPEESSSDMVDGIEKDVVVKAKELMAEDKSLTQPMAIAKALKIKHKRI